MHTSQRRGNERSRHERSHVALAPLCLIELRLVPGMLVNAEIHLGTRTVLEYLLSPVQKVA